MQRKIRRGEPPLPFLIILAVILLVLMPTAVPPLWFDEGWALSLARNWVELGHYGHLLAGERVAPTILNTGLPAVAPIALSFRLFGVGPLQGRLPGIAFTAGGLVMLYYLARRLYDSSVAASSLSVVLLLSAERSLHPVLLGRQALGEMPSLFYLLTGFAFLSWAWKSPRRCLPPAMVAWALSLRTKPQILPFLLVALCFPLGVGLRRRCWKTVCVLGAALIGTSVAFGILAWGEKLLLGGSLFLSSPEPDPYRVLFDPGNLFTYVCVPVPSVRLTAVAYLVLFATPLVLGMWHAGAKLFGRPQTEGIRSGLQVCRQSLWILVVTWLGWYALMSIGWTRYLFPPLFVGSIFTAVLLRDLVGGFSVPCLIIQGAETLRNRRFTVRGAQILSTAIAVPFLLLGTLSVLHTSYVELPDDSLIRTARFLNERAERAALIETYDSELFFLLERAYHYPPDSVQHQLNRRAFLGETEVIDYDPTAVNPDYLVVGHMSRWWGLYQPVLESGAFRMVRTDGLYQVYERLN